MTKVAPCATKTRCHRTHDQRGGDRDTDLWWNEARRIGQTPGEASP